MANDLSTNDHDCLIHGCHYEGSMFCIWCGLTKEDREDEDYRIDTRPCDREFGPHDHDDAKCAQILADMSGDTGFHASYNPQSGQWDPII